MMAPGSFQKNRAVRRVVTIFFFEASTSSQVFRIDHNALMPRLPAALSVTAMTIAMSAVFPMVMNC